MDLVYQQKQKTAEEAYTPHTSSYEYSVSFGQPRRVQSKVYISPKEAQHLAIAALLVVGIGFSIAMYAGFFDYLGWTWPIASVFALLLTASFLIHEMAHKITAQKRGLWAEFRLTTWGAIITLISIVSPIKLISPGAVMISGPARMDEIAKISIAGPIINMAIGAAFLGAASLPALSLTYVSLFAIVAFINGIIAAFNLIPFGILDGFKIFSWDKKVWALGFAVAVAITVPSWLIAAPYL